MRRLLAACLYWIVWCGNGDAQTIKIERAFSLSVHQNSITFSGMLHDQSVSEIVAALQGVPEPARATLVITSSGGFDEAAVVLGEYIQEKNVRVVVKDRCISNCANFVFLVAKTKSTLDRSIVGFHTSTVSWDSLLESGNWIESEAGKRERKLLVLRSKVLLKKSGVPDNFMDCVVSALRPNVETLREARLENSRGEIVAAPAIEFQNDFMLLSPSLVRTANLPSVQGMWWTDDPVEYRSVLSSQLPGARVTIGRNRMDKGLCRNFFSPAELTAQ
jgi:hypothetical protein